MHWINVQLQSGGDDCALFAITFAEALCAGRDPFILGFDQLQMRQHLKLCLERGAVTKFPESTRQERGCQKRSTYIAHVACLGISKEKWHSVSIVRSGSTKIIPDAVFTDSLSVWGLRSRPVHRGGVRGGSDEPPFFGHLA